MPNGFLPTDLPPILPVDPIPTRRPLQSAGGGGPSRREASGPRKRGGTNEPARAARANEPAKRPQRIKLLRIGAGIRPRMARWIDPMANPVGAPGSALCFDAAGKKKEMAQKRGKGGSATLSVPSRGGASEGARWGRARRVEKKGGRKNGGRMGRRSKKKTEDQVRRFAAPGDKKKEAMRLLFFLHFASAPRGA